MKKLILVFALLLGFTIAKAQTCSSPVILDGLNGSFSAIDSFNVQDRFFKFTANNPTHRIKAHIHKVVLFTRQGRCITCCI